MRLRSRGERRDHRDHRQEAGGRTGTGTGTGNPGPLDEGASGTQGPRTKPRGTRSHTGNAPGRTSPSQTLPRRLEQPTKRKRKGRGRTVRRSGASHAGTRSREKRADSRERERERGERRSAARCGLHSSRGLNLNGTEQRIQKQTHQHEHTKVIFNKSAKVTQWKRKTLSNWCKNNSIHVGKKKRNKS